MIIDRLLTIPSAPASGDELPIERGTNAYKIDYNALADAIVAKTQSGLAIIVNGDTASMAVPVGGYAYIRNNTHGLAEGLYTNTSSSVFPVSGGTANSSVFTAVSGGMGAEITSIKSKISPTAYSQATNGIRYRKLGNIVMITGENWNTDISSTITTILPVEYRPSRPLTFSGVDGETAQNVIAISVDSNGNLSVRNYNSDASLHKGYTFTATYIVD